MAIDRDKAFEIDNGIILDDDTVHISSGADVPSHTGNEGDIYLRTDSSTYKYTSGAWVRVDLITNSSTTSTDNAIVRWDGTTGQIIQDGSNSTIDDSGNMILNGDIDVIKNMYSKGFGTNITELVSAAQTTQMLSSDSFAFIISGSTDGQILRLPDATTLKVGEQFYIMNESSVSITIEDYSGGDTQTLLDETNTIKILRDNSTAAGVWTKSVGVNFAAGKLRDPRQFVMNGTMGNGDWVSISNLLSDYKYVFTEEVKLIGMEWSNANGNSRDFDLEFYKNGTTAGDIVRTYEVRNSTLDYGAAVGWTEIFEAGDYMRVKYIDQGSNCSDFGGRFNFEVVT